MENSWIYERITLEFDPETRIIKEFDAVNFIETEEDKFVTVEENVTEYPENYKTPTELGNDIYSRNI